MHRALLPAIVACLLAPGVRAQSASQMCSQDRGAVFCRVQIFSQATTADPVFVVSASVVRTVPTVRVTAITRATDCAMRSEQRNSMALGTSAGGQMAQFNWPVALQGTRRRCVEIEMSECRGVDDRVVYCASVINTMQSRVSVRW